MKWRLTLAVLWLWACEPPEPEIIGPEGGAVSLVEGAVLSIPPGALEDDVALRIHAVRLPAQRPPAWLALLGDIAYAFEPEGRAFPLPVRVALPFSPARASGGAVHVHRLNLATQELEDLGGALVRPGVVMAETRRLSVFVVGYTAPPQGDR